MEKLLRVSVETAKLYSNKIDGCVPFIYTQPFICYQINQVLMTSTHHAIPDVLETSYTDSDVERAYTEPIDTGDTVSPTYSKSVMQQYRRAKRASKKCNERSKKIVKQLNKERMNKKTPKKHETKRKQKTVFDFGGN